MHDIGIFSIYLQDEMVIFIIAYRHGFEGISMIGVVKCQYRTAVVFTGVYIILQGHFQSDFHGDTAGVGEKAIIQVAGQPVSKFFRQFLGRLVGKTTKHDVRKLCRLLADSIGDLRLMITIDNAPPGRYGIQ